MEKLFFTVLNMSYQAGIVICIILLARWLFLLCRIPRKYMYALWGIPFVRLVCPLSVESIFSLIPKEAVQIQRRVSQLVEESVDLGRAGGEPAFNLPISGLLAATPEYSVDPVQVLLWIGSLIWLTGVAVMFIYSFWSLLQVRRSLCSGMRLKENIYLADEISMPFVWGFLRPRIYLPSGMEEDSMRYVLLHEQIHVRRRDSIWKAAAFLITAVYWFHPLVWVAFLCMGNDMEMSCDEAVMEGLESEERTAYARTLLSLSAGRRRISAPLAFGEGNTRERIKNIMKYKKPWLITGVFAVLATAVLIFTLFTNPPGEQTGLSQGQTVSDEPGDTAEISTEKTTEKSAEKNTETENTIADVEQISVSEPKLSPDMTLGADGAFLDYADSEIIIFHGYFGLFVYSMGNQGIAALNTLLPQGIVRAVDLQEIGCQDTQGENACEVSVSADGKYVYLHPMQDERMYVYDVWNGTMVRQRYSLDGIDLFDSYAEISEMGVNDSYSPYGIRFGAEEPYYGYLISPAGTIGDLSYMETDMIVRLFTVRVHPITGVTELEGNREHALTLERFLDIVKAGQIASYDFSIFTNGEYDGLGDDALNYYISYLCRTEHGDVRLHILYKKEDNSLWLVSLKKESDGSSIVIYSQDSGGLQCSDQDIRDFIETDYDIRNEITFRLPGELTVNPYQADTGFGGGCIFLPAAYESGTDFTPAEWVCAGMVSRYKQSEMLIWEGDVIKDIAIYYNHTQMEIIETVQNLSAPALLVHGNHDLYTASEAEELKNSGVDMDTVDLTSDYWYLFIAEPGAEYGYVVSLNQKNYTKADMLKLGESIQLLQ